MDAKRINDRRVPAAPACEARAATAGERQRASNKAPFGGRAARSII
jgi:hypothetical protein